MNVVLDQRIQTVLDAPLFIIGVPRSGTTWLQRILLALPQVCGGQESHFFPVFGPALRSFYSSKQSHRKAGLYWYWDEAEFKQELVNLWYKTMIGVVTASPQATMLIEKTPDHSDYISEILQLLPQARFIHLIRDSRAVVASLVAASQEAWGTHWAPKTARDAAIFWRKRLEKARYDGAQLPAGAYLEVHYEDLMADTVRQAQRVLRFIGLDIPDAGLAQIIETQSFSQLATQNQATISTQSATKALPTEPQGFFRQGRADSWKTDLSLWQQLVVWRHTRYAMRASGYSWQGRVLPSGSLGVEQGG